MKDKNYIAKIRKQKGISQEELAHAIETSQAQIGRLENGQRKISQEWLEKLSKALECSPMEILYDETDDKSSLDHLKVLEKNFKDDDIIKMNIEILKKLIAEKDK